MMGGLYASMRNVGIEHGPAYRTLEQVQATAMAAAMAGSVNGCGGCNDVSDGCGGEGKAPARVRSTNVRGTKFAMPAPQSGRHAKNLILAEDQLAEAREKARRQGKMKSFDVFDPDYDNEAHFGRTGKKGGARGGALQVGYGKRNPNDVRSRTKKR